ncbi:hypothetical protein GCM10009119_38220 [Algoriphagus jejuensis]|uniref:Pentapeptide repeat protein n=1 Tax=Algoriphagus jejuensis TaxID=419934 RepID=A0ABP3YJI9_9BACT
MKIQKVEIKDDCAEVNAKNAMLDNSSFSNVSMRNVIISDANLSDLKIDGAQIGGALIKNIGMPDGDHPNYDPDLKHRPVRFELCDFKTSLFIECDLSQVRLENCNIAGLTINGIAIDQLLANSKK